MTDWIEAAGIDALERCRRDVLASVCGGVDPDHDGMIEALGDEVSDMDDADLEASWFDACIAGYRLLFAAGPARLHRAISTSDPAALIEALEGGAHPGDCWTWDETCATTSLHPGDRGTHDVRIVADVSEDSVSWGATLQCGFSRPWEREIRVRGPVSIVSATAVPLD